MKRRSIVTLFALLFAAGSAMLSGPLLAQDQTRDRLQLQDQVDVPDMDRDRIQDRLQDREDAIQDRDRDRIHDQLDDPIQDRDQIQDRVDQVEEPDRDQVRDRIHQ